MTEEQRQRRNKRQLAYYYKNREHALAVQKIYREKKRAEMTEEQKEEMRKFEKLRRMAWTPEKLEAMRAYARAYYYARKEEKLEYQKKYYLNRKKNERKNHDQREGD